MGKCRNCGKKGLFLSVDQNGLCKSCAPRVILELQGRKRIMDDSMKLALEGKTFNTRLLRCDLLLEHAEHLLEYEQKGIPTISPRPSEIISEFRSYRDQLILDEAQKAADKAITKAEVAATSSTKHSALSQGFMKVQEIMENHSNPNAGVALENDLKNRMHKVKLEGFLDAARKAEFKGNRKKALDQYQEALYLLRTDDIPDDTQKDFISELEAKLKELSESD